MNPRMLNGNYMAFPAFSGTYISCEIIGLKIDSTWGDITGGIQTKVFPFSMHLQRQTLRDKVREDIRWQCDEKE